MGLLATTPITKAGVAKTLGAAASGGDTFDNTEAETLEIKNGHATDPRTVYVAMYVDGKTIVQGHSITVPALTTMEAGPFEARFYSNPANNRCSLTYSNSAADLTIGVFKR